MKNIWLVCLFFCLCFLTACGQSTETQENQQTESPSTTQETAVSEKEAPSEEATATQHTAATESENVSGSQSENAAASENAPAQQNANTQPSGQLKVHFIDAGQADATLFQYSDGEENYTILYDTGDWNQTDVVDYLANQNISSIDLIVLSHPDADHIGQLAEIVRTHAVDEVWMSGNTSTSDTFQEALASVIDSGAAYHEPRAGEKFSIGPMDIEVLYPNTVTGASNEESISLKFTYGDSEFLLTGDAGTAEEMEMTESGAALSADVLSLGHHGSDTSSHPAFIEAVNPTIAIYSAGLDNIYGHPSPEVVSRIENAGIDLYGTAMNGTIIVTTDGDNLNVNTETKGSDHTSAADTEMEEDSTENVSEPLPEPTGACVNMNEASAGELDQIIHIGPERAKDVIDNRPYASVDDLSQIDGIGDARISDIKAEGLACIGGSI